jgi:hypothetical protein
MLVSSCSQSRAATARIQRTRRRVFKITNTVPIGEAGDVKCQADCITVPSPNEDAVNETNDCVAACPKGNGTETDILNYDMCVSGCISDFYYTTPGSNGPTATGNEDSSSEATPVVSTVTSGSSTFQTTVTPTPSGSSSSGGAGAQSTSTSGGGADMLFSPIGSTGLVGLLAAIFAL